jgi:hypothetical protein
MKNLKKCFQYKQEWDKCSNLIFIKYYDNDDHKSYYEEMNICFDFYKKYNECLLQK